MLHYVTDGTAKLRIAHRRALYYIPIVLVIKCLADVTDEFIYDQVMAGHEDDLYFKGCVLNMLRQVHDSNVHTHADANAYLGKTFRIRVASELPPWATDQAIAKYILRFVPACTIFTTPTHSQLLRKLNFMKVLNFQENCLYSPR